MALTKGNMVFRPGGSNNNPGYWNTAGTGTNYSNQDAAQISLSGNVSSDAAGTTIAVTGSLLSSAIVGNGFQVTGAGTGLTLGTYEIKTYVDANTFTIDRSAGSSKSGGTGYIGGARALFTNSYLSSAVAGMNIYSKTGTYNVTEAINFTAAGSNTDPIRFIGFTTTPGDVCNGDNRPVINMGAYSFATYSNNFIYDENMVFTGTAAEMRNDQSGAFNIINCSYTNTSVTADRKALYVSGVWGDGEEIECVSTNGYGMYIPQNGCDVKRATCRDSKYGAYVGGNYFVNFNNCVFDTCSTAGIYSDGFYVKLANNTFYNCGDGFYNSSTNGQGIGFVGNIFANCTDGIHFSNNTYIRSHIQRDNNFYGNTNDVTNYTKEPTALALDPQFVDAAGGDFRVGENMVLTKKTPNGVDYSYTLGAIPYYATAGGGTISYGRVS